MCLKTDTHTHTWWLKHHFFHNRRFKLQKETSVLFLFWWNLRSYIGLLVSWISKRPPDSSPLPSTLLLGGSARWNGGRLCDDNTNVMVLNGRDALGFEENATTWSLWGNVTSSSWHIVHDIMMSVPLPGLGSLLPGSTKGHLTNLFLCRKGLGRDAFGHLSFPFVSLRHGAKIEQTNLSLFHSSFCLAVCQWHHFVSKNFCRTASPFEGLLYFKEVGLVINHAKCKVMEFSKYGLEVLLIGIFTGNLSSKLVDLGQFFIWIWIGHTILEMHTPNLQ